MSLSAPDLLRMDAFMGFLSIPLGSLVIQNESVVFVNIVEGKIYKTNKGSAVLEKLLKTNISPKDIIALFAGKYPLPAPWTCSSENNEKDSLCELKDLKVIRAREDQDKKMQIDSQRSKINFSYQSQTSGKTDFKINEPRNFEVIEL